MKLKEACELGKEIGCRTVGEAILNVEHSATSLFKWSEMAEELRELVEEAKDIDDNCLIEDLKFNE